MAKYREAPCQFYICKGQCSKNKKDVSQNGICQTCNCYLPRVGYISRGNIERKKKIAESQKKDFD